MKESFGHKEKIKQIISMKRKGIVLDSNLSTETFNAGDTMCF